MKICEHCGVKIKNDIKYCPLCDMKATEIIDDGEYSNDYPHIKTGFTRGLLLKLLTFIAVFFVAASFTIDHLVPTGSPWAFITSSAIIYSWLSAMNVLKNTPNPASIILCQLISVSGLVFLVDYFTGYYRWSINYVIPFLIIGASLTITLMVFIKPIKYRAYTIYQLTIAILGVLSCLLWLFGYSEIEWPVVVAAFTSVTCFVSSMVFSYRKAKNELTKRFHI